MKFVLEVDLTPLAGGTTAELSRILRYWAGNLHHYSLTPEDASPVYDSAYTEVGSWRIEESRA